LGKAKISISLAMQNYESHPPSKPSRKARASATRTAKPRSSIENLPDSIAEEVELERRSEIFPSQMWSPHYPEEGKQARSISAVDRVANMQAVGPAAEMLSVMLVNTFEAYVDCQRRAMIHADDPRLFAIHGGHAERLIKLYLLQLAAFDKHQTRGAQQISVEHVHVSAGGRAIVGHVDVHPAKGGSVRSQPHTPSSTN
jgi:hypothetical protein